MPNAGLPTGLASNKNALHIALMGAWVVEHGVLLAAVVLLVLVGSLPAPPQQLTKWAWPVLLGALLGGAASFKLGLRQTSFVPPGKISGTIKYAVRHVASAREANVLFLDGGSLVQKGVDARLLTQELHRRGYSVRVVRLAQSAANHFERYELYRDLLNRLPAAHPNQRWVFLAETHVQYDLQPLAQFHGNRDTTRALHYLTPENAFHALMAQRDPQLDLPSEGPWRFDLLRQASTNGLNVGVTNRLVPLAEVSADSGAVPRSRRRWKQKFTIDPLLKEIRRPTPDREPPLWTKRIRQRRLLRLWGSRLDDLVYFGVPTTRVDQLKYVRGFCKRTQRKCIAPTEPKLFKKLKSRRAWLDENHLSKRGAREYTTWLAARLAEEGVLTK